MNELYHYGVPGMKWGVRRARSKSVSDAYTRMQKAKKNRKTANRQLDKAYRDHNGMLGKIDKNYTSKNMMNASQKAAKADKEYKKQKQAYKAIKKIEKQQYKDFVKKRSKEIKAGESAIGKIYDTLTDAHKYQAKIEYDMKNRRYK